MSKQRRFSSMKLPRPIVSIHNAFDDWERAKKRRTTANKKVAETQAKLADVMKRHKDKLQPIGKGTTAGSFLYKLCGYRIVLKRSETVEGQRIPTGS